MPELPDIRLYLSALAPRIGGQRLQALRILNPFVLRTVTPPVEAISGRLVVAIERIGKRIILCLDGEIFVAIHLMIAGRFRWLAPGRKPPGRIALATLEFASGSLVLTEAGTRRRAAVHLVAGREGLALFRRGGIDVELSDLPTFAAAIQRENHTLRRALTDPTILDGIGNAYSDEILHRARMSPLQLTRRLEFSGIETLYLACRAVLGEWTARLETDQGAEFPEKVTAFRAGMAAHGRYKQPCPACQSPIQRIRYANNETNYCPTCQTGGRLLADRSLSRLLREDWPRSLEELEELRERAKGG